MIFFRRVKETVKFFNAIYVKLYFIVGVKLNAIARNKIDKRTKYKF